jgi:N-acetylglucosaminyldiphosphoundecaprenol N-acetyl-beta-D-mannosaminyltransferase
MGHVPVNALRFSDALDAIEQLIRTGGGAVFTPNVDHVVMAEHDVAFRAAYRRAELSLADGQPVVWASRLFTNSVPDKVSGSDLLLPLMKRAALRGWRVFLLGGAPGVAQRAAELLRELHAVDVVGIASPRVRTPPPQELLDALADSLREARADLVVVALGAPKQELLIDALKDRVRPAALVGMGAALDFLVGRVARAPPWMSRFGLEWLYRLLKEPRRLWRRYLLRDPAFFGIVLRQLWSQWVGRRALPAGG